MDILRANFTFRGRHVSVSTEGYLTYAGSGQGYHIYYQLVLQMVNNNLELRTRYTPGSTMKKVRGEEGPLLQIGPFVPVPKAYLSRF